MASEKYNEQGGVWRTVGGRRVFIKTGQSLSEAMIESGKFPSAKKKALTIGAESDRIVTREDILSDPESEAFEIDRELDDFTEKDSKWSGKLNFNQKMCDKCKCIAAKEWNCDILVGDNITRQEMMHELLHARSVSYYTLEQYVSHAALEEGATELYAREIMKKQCRNVQMGAYDSYVRALRMFNRELSMYENDFDFAKELFNTSMTKRRAFIQRNLDMAINEKRVDTTLAREIQETLDYIVGGQ
jgi:hypothetical protein